MARRILVPLVTTWIQLPSCFAIAWYWLAVATSFCFLLLSLLIIELNHWILVTAWSNPCRFFGKISGNGHFLTAQSHLVGFVPTGRRTQPLDFQPGVLTTTPNHSFCLLSSSHSLLGRLGSAFCFPKLKYLLFPNFSIWKSYPCIKRYLNAINILIKRCWSNQLQNTLGRAVCVFVVTNEYSHITKILDQIVYFFSLCLQDFSGPWLQNDHCFLWNLF